MRLNETKTFILEHELTGVRFLLFAPSEERAKQFADAIDNFVSGSLKKPSDFMTMVMEKYPDCGFIFLDDRKQIKSQLVQEDLLWLNDDKGGEAS